MFSITENHHNPINTSLEIIISIKNASMFIKNLKKKTANVRNYVLFFCYKIIIIINFVNLVVDFIKMRSFSYGFTVLTTTPRTSCSCVLTSEEIIVRWSLAFVFHLRPVSLVYRPVCRYLFATRCTTDLDTIRDFWKF